MPTPKLSDAQTAMIEAAKDHPNRLCAPPALNIAARSAVAGKLVRMGLVFRVELTEAEAEMSWGFDEEAQPFGLALVTEADASADDLSAEAIVARNKARKEAQAAADALKAAADAEPPAPPAERIVRPITFTPPPARAAKPTKAEREAAAKAKKEAAKAERIARLAAREEAAKVQPPKPAPAEGEEGEAADAPKPIRLHAKTREMMEAARSGAIPDAPDFSAPTHKAWRKKLAEIVAMVEAGDIEGLRANEVQPASSSRVQLCRYRDAAIAALLAREAGPEAPEGEGQEGEGQEGEGEEAAA